MNFLKNDVLSILKIQQLHSARQYRRLKEEDALEDASMYLVPEDDDKVSKSGDTMEGILVAQSNTEYTTKQVRNIYLIAEGQSLPEGSNGDICFTYIP